MTPFERLMYDAGYTKVSKDEFREQLSRSDTLKECVEHYSLIKNEWNFYIK